MRNREKEKRERKKKYERERERAKRDSEGGREPRCVVRENARERRER